MHKPVIHATDFDTYTTCPRKFWFESILRIKPKNYKEPNYFSIGKSWHTLLNAHYSGANNIEEILDQIKYQNFENYSLLTFLFSEYKKRWDKEDEKIKSAIISNENSMTAEFDDFILAFTIDLSFKDGDNIHIMDHKLYDKLKFTGGLDLWAQPNLYMLGLNKIGVYARKFTLNQTRKTVYTMPKVLTKKGVISISKAKTELAKTTYELYDHAIKQYNLDPSDYIEELTFLKNADSALFSRNSFFRPKEALPKIERNYANIARRIAKLSKDKLPIAFPGSHCELYKCKFIQLCRIHFSGGNIMESIDAGFDTKTEEER